MQRTQAGQKLSNELFMSAQDTRMRFDMTAKVRLEIVVTAGTADKLEAVKFALYRLGVKEFLESALICHSHERQKAMSYRGVEFVTDYVDKVRLEMLVPTEDVEGILQSVEDAAGTVGLKDWQAYVMPEIFPVELKPLAPPL